MAQKGVAFFDNRGQFFKTPEDATVSDLSALLGRIGDGDSLAPGIATMLLEKRREIEKIFADHDAMRDEDPVLMFKVPNDADNVTSLPAAKVTHNG